MQEVLPPNKNNFDPNDPSSKELVQKFLDVQVQEIEIRKKELDVNQHYDDNNLNYAKEALKAQKEDRECERAYRHRTIKLFFIFGSIILLILVGFLVFAVMYGKEDLAMKVIEMVIVFAGGSAGGYAVGRHKGASQAEADD